MKKIKYLVPILGLLCSFNAHALNDIKTAETTINFSVKILQKQCKVSFGPSDDGKTINVGRLFKKHGSEGALIPLRFKFSECQGAEFIESISFTRDVFGSGHTVQDKHITTQMNGNPSTVKIFLYNDQSKSSPFTSKDFGSVGHKITGEWIDVCFVQAVIPKNVQLPEKGDFIAQAEFTITYL